MKFSVISWLIPAEKAARIVSIIDFVRPQTLHKFPKFSFCLFKFYNFQVTGSLGLTIASFYLADLYGGKYSFTTKTNYFVLAFRWYKPDRNGKYPYL